MAIQVLDFPTLSVETQLFYAGGTSYDGGFTSGGSTLMSPEPGGRSYLELQLSLQIGEWDNPAVSWLMSKCTNGTVFRVPLTKTPQLLSDVALGLDSYMYVPWHDIGVYPDNVWDDDQPWSADGFDVAVVSDAFEGSTVVTIDMTGFGALLKPGHVIGFNSVSYMIDNIEDATLTLNPPLRSDLTSDDMLLTRPYFTGMITNGSEFRANYEASNVGNIKPARLLFSEVIV